MWSAVTETTIKNCWRKTGILPPDNEASTVNELNFDIIESEINNLQSSIDSLGLEKPMSAEQYMNIDEEIEARNINDEEIVSLVNRSLFQEKDKIEEPAIYPTVNVKSALESLHVLSDFLSNPPAEYKIII